MMNAVSTNMIFFLLLVIAAEIALLIGMIERRLQKRFDKIEDALYRKDEFYKVMHNLVLSTFANTELMKKE
jgi:hypothetical protein